VLPKVWAVPRGTSTNPSRPTASSLPSTMIETTPSSTKYASEQFVWRCGGGRRPPGGRVRSISDRSPPSSSAVALKNISLPRAV
jgi:hypothetical protein